MRINGASFKPPLNGGHWLITGYISGSGSYQLQEAKCYSPNIISYHFRNRYNGNWLDWDKNITNSDLYEMYRIGDNTTFAKVLDGRNNKITPFAFYNPSDNPFSFSMGYGIAFHASLLHNNKMFTLLGFEKTATKIEVKQFTIT